MTQPAARMRTSGAAGYTQTTQRCIYRGSAAPYRKLHSSRSIATYAVASAPPTSGPTVQQLQQLCDWCKAKGNGVDKVSVVPSPANGQAMLVAAKDMSAGEAILSINDSQWLSLEAVKKSSIGKAVEGLEPWLQLALYLIHLQHVSSDANWSPYLATLQNQQSSPLFWNDSQLQMVQGTQMLETLQGYKAFFSMKYQELFGQSGRLAGQAALFPAAAFTYDNFVAAVAAVRARTHAPLEGDKVSLVPLADMVAHRRNANVTWKVKSAGLFGRGQTLVVEATRPIKQGDEISMDYAPGKPEGAALLDYGVMDGTSPQHGYTLSLSLDANERLIDDKRDIVENNPGLSESMQFVLSPNVPPTDTMMGFLRLRELKGMDVFLLEPVFSADVWSFMCEPVSEDNERAVCNMMAQGARAAMSRYASTIDADLALLRGGTLQQGSPEEAAVKVRLGELECLDSLAQWSEERADGLSRLAYYQERRLRRLGLIDDEGRTTYDSFFKDGIA